MRSEVNELGQLEWSQVIGSKYRSRSLIHFWLSLPSSLLILLDITRFETKSVDRLSIKLSKNLAEKKKQTKRRKREVCSLREEQNSSRYNNFYKRGKGNPTQTERLQRLTLSSCCTDVRQRFLLHLEAECSGTVGETSITPSTSECRIRGCKRKLNKQ